MANFPIERFRQTPTPFYYYDTALLHQTIEEASQAAGAINIHYAVKANSDPALLRIIASAGWGADCVSGGEVRAAVDAGFAAPTVFYAGVGKSDREIADALRLGIGCFNVESVEELEAIGEIASSLGVTAPVALRVNPGIDAHTHHYITTGLEENKFGIAMGDMLDHAAGYAAASPSLRLVGLHFHIGSQITTTEPFALLCRRAVDLVDAFAGRGIKIESVNVGGGLGVDYIDPDSNPIPDFEGYFGTLNAGLAPLLRRGITLHCELGRSIVAQCGSLISRVLYVKRGATGKRFAILDAGMTDLIRPALYGARHEIDAITAAADDPVETYDVVGPVCESSDSFGSDFSLPQLRRGDLVAIRSAGAYGQSMASSYNLRPLAPTVLG